MDTSSKESPSLQSGECQQWFESWLADRFGGMDYWQLPKDWKQVHFASCASELMIALDIEIEHAVKQKEAE